MANETIKLNLIPEGEMPVFHCSQFDNGRPITIELYNGEDTYTPAGGLSLELRCRKCDRNIVTLASTSVVSNVVTFTSTKQLTACSGDNEAEIRIKDSNSYVLGTLNFIIRVEKDPTNGGLTSATAIHDLTDQITDIATAIIGDDYYNKTESDERYVQRNALNIDLDDLTDVNITTPENGQVLKYDAASDKWVNGTGGGGEPGTNDYTDLINKPSINSVTLSGNKNTADLNISYNDLSNKPTLAAVATSGSYNDLSNKPSIPAAQVNSDWNSDSGVSQILNKPTLAAVATSGSYNDLTNKPSLATVATSGNYIDLTNKPVFMDITSLVTFNETPGGSTKFYYKDGALYLIYQSAAGTHASDDLLFTLPIGYRPSTTETIIPFIKNANAYGNVKITGTTGQCTVNIISNTSVSGRIYFNAVIPL